jgi:hypothetical protein
MWTESFGYYDEEIRVSQRKALKLLSILRMNEWIW